MLEEAREYFERAYIMSYEGQGARHSETATMAINLAQLIAEHFEHEVYQAVPLLRLSLKTGEVINGLENSETQQCRRILGETLLQCVSVSRSTREAGSDFRAGDRIQLCEDGALNRALAEKHGGWADDMDRYSGQEGTVRGIDSDGDVFVKFDIGGREAGIEHRAKTCFCFNPVALTLVSRPEPEAAAAAMTLGDAVRTNPTPPLQQPRGEKQDQADDDDQQEQQEQQHQPGLPPGATTWSAWSGTDEEAERLVVEEAEVLLLRALAVLEKDVEEAKSARSCAKALLELYETTALTDGKSGGGGGGGGGRTANNNFSSRLANQRIHFNTLSKRATFWYIKQVFGDRK